jgi:hypothetical protein
VVPCYRDYHTRDRGGKMNWFVPGRRHYSL